VSGVPIVAGVSGFICVVVRLVDVTGTGRSMGRRRRRWVVVMIVMVVRVRGRGRVHRDSTHS